MNTSSIPYAPFRNEATRLAEERDSGNGDAFDDEWKAIVFAAAMERLRTETNPVHFQAFYASAIEGLDSASVQKLCGISAGNLYQIRRRVSLRLRALVEEAARDLDAPDLPATSDDPTGSAPTAVPSPLPPSAL